MILASADGSTILVSAVGVLIAFLGVLVAVLGYRRAAQSADKNDFKVQVELWTAEIDRLKDQNADQAIQIRELRDQNRQLTEMVTNAAKVDQLAQTVTANHDALMAAIAGLKGAAA